MSADVSTAPRGTDEVSPYVLIGAAFALHREVFAGVFRAQRPDIPVCTVPAVELDATVAQYRPALVISDAISAIVEALVPAWILLQPASGQDTIVSVAGRRRAIPHPTIQELLGLVDEIWHGARP